MSKAAHTQIPWQRSWVDEEKAHYIEDLYGNTVAVVARRAEQLDSAGLLSNVTRANADLIVTAVNHHQELVTRLYNLVNAVDVNNHEATQDCINEARETLKKVIE